MASGTKYQLSIVASVNGHVRKCTVFVRDRGGNTIFTDRADLADAKERQKLAATMAEKLDINADSLSKRLDKAWYSKLDEITADREEAERQRQDETVQQHQGPEDIDERDERLLGEMPDEIQEDAAEYLRTPDLMERINKDIHALGVAGEHRLRKTLYLVGTSRKLSRPLAALAKGPTSSGKSFVIEKVSNLFPPEAKLVATSLTPQALYYMEPGRLRHVWVVAGERSRRQNEEVADVTKALREMISAGKLSKLLPVKIEGGTRTV
jgi:hypothetical protein